MSVKDLIICPICKEPLYENQNTFSCKNRHSFDVSASGYVNLLNPGKKNNRVAGDDKAMIKARSSFFECGAYSKIRSFLCNIISEYGSKVIIDSGCGEGYYTYEIANSDTSRLVFGIDISKYGVEHASKVAKRNGFVNVFYSVGNIFDLPVKDECADTVISVFAPIAFEENLRVLKKGGHLIIASAGENHLDGLKKSIYENVYLNEPSDFEFRGYGFIEKRNLKYEIQIEGNDCIKNLFTMTPYYYRTSLSDKEKLENISSVTTTVEVDFTILKKV